MERRGLLLGTFGEGGLEGGLGDWGIRLRNDMMHNAYLLREHYAYLLLGIVRDIHSRPDALNTKGDIDRFNNMLIFIL